MGDSWISDQFSFYRRRDWELQIWSDLPRVVWKLNQVWWLKYETNYLAIWQKLKCYTNSLTWPLKGWAFFPSLWIWAGFSDSLLTNRQKQKWLWAATETGQKWPWSFLLAHITQLPNWGPHCSLWKGFLGRELPLISSQDSESSCSPSQAYRWCSSWEPPVEPLPDPNQQTLSETVQVCFKCLCFGVPWVLCYFSHTPVRHLCSAP